MFAFLIAAVVTFGLCWVWVGGYLADFVVWLISKLTPDSSNEQNLAYVIGVAFFVLGVIVALTTENGRVAPTTGGAIAGAGLYVAVRLPGKIRYKRLRGLEKALAGEPPVEVARTPPVGVAPTQAPAVAASSSTESSPPAGSPLPMPEPAVPDRERTTAWAEVNDPRTSSARLAEVVGRYPEFGQKVLEHPNVYPELTEWIHQLPVEAG